MTTVYTSTEPWFLASQRQCSLPSLNMLASAIFAGISMNGTKRFLTLCKEYLAGTIAVNDFVLERIKLSPEYRGTSSIPHKLNLRKHPAELNEAVESALFNSSFGLDDKGEHTMLAFREDEFRIRLAELCNGYQTARRNAIFWEVKDSKVKKG